MKDTVSKGFRKFREIAYRVAKESLRNKVKGSYSWEPSTPVTKESDVQYHTMLVGTRVHTGGTSGGSCWDDSNPRPYTVDDAEPLELRPMDDLLAEVCPQITFLQYKRLNSIAGIKTDSVCETEYYGNSSNYSWRVVEVGKLYDALCEMNVLKPEHGGSDEE